MSAFFPNSKDKCLKISKDNCEPFSVDHVFVAVHPVLSEKGWKTAVPTRKRTIS